MQGDKIITRDGPPAGYQVIAHLGIVKGSCHSYEQGSARTLEEAFRMLYPGVDGAELLAILRMAETAVAMGADAVVGFRFFYAKPYTTCYGTAVKLVAEESDKVPEAACQHAAAERVDLEPSAHESSGDCGKYFLQAKEAIARMSLPQELEGPSIWAFMDDDDLARKFVLATENTRNWVVQTIAAGNVEMLRTGEKPAGSDA